MKKLFLKWIAMSVCILLLLEICPLDMAILASSENELSCNFDDGVSTPFSKGKFVANSTGLPSLGNYYYCPSSTFVQKIDTVKDDFLVIQASVRHPGDAGLSFSISQDGTNFVKVVHLSRSYSLSTCGGDWAKFTFEANQWYDLKIVLDKLDNSLSVMVRKTDSYEEYHPINMAWYNNAYTGTGSNNTYVQKYYYDGTVKNGNATQNNGFLPTEINYIKIDGSNSITKYIDNLSFKVCNRLYREVNSAADNDELSAILEEYETYGYISYQDLKNQEGINDILNSLLSRKYASDDNFLTYYSLFLSSLIHIGGSIRYMHDMANLKVDITGGTLSGAKTYAAIYHNKNLADIRTYQIAEGSYTENIFFKSENNEKNYSVKLITLFNNCLLPVKKTITLAYNNECVLADYSTQSACTNAGFTYSENHSTEGGAAQMIGSGVKSFQIKTDSVNWNTYSELNIEMYSKAATMDNLYWALISENPLTSGSDYYYKKQTLDYEGEWKTLTFRYNPANPSLSQDFNISRSPLGFGAVTLVNFWPNYGNAVVSENTEIYIKRIYLTKGDNYISEVEEDTPVSELIPDANTDKITYDIASLCKSNQSQQAHPRLLSNAESLADNIRLFKEGADSFITRTGNNIITKADNALQKEDSVYSTPDGKRLISTEREMIKPLAVAYLLTGDDRYKIRCFHAMEVMASWPDWNPTHYLCTAEAAYSFALAYDLLYNEWDEYEKSVIRNALATHAIEKSLPYWRTHTGVAANVNNWQEVCGGGIAMACLALCDEPGYEDVCSELVSEIIGTIPQGLAAYAPDGAFPEGPSYWSYASRFFFNFDASLYHTCGTDFGLSNYEGLNNTGYFPLIANGPTGCFNYSDCGTGVVRAGCMFWIAKLYNQPLIATYAATASSYGNYEDFLSYDDAMVKSMDYSTFPLDYQFNGEQCTAYTRSSWTDNNAMWLAFKGGYNKSSHGDLDIGQFVFDSQGIRWFCDLGSAYYEAPGMWTYTAAGRFAYYRKRAEAHNTLVLNPDSGADQVITANGTIDSFKSSEGACVGIVNMSSAYAGDADSVYRGFVLRNNRTEVIIRDEVKTSVPIGLYSFFTTQQNITIDSADPTKAYLTNGTKQIRIDIVEPAGATWGTMAAQPLPTSPDPEENYHTGYTNENFSKLFIHLNAVTNPTVSVVIRNYDASIGLTEHAAILPLSQWDNYLEGKIVVPDIKTGSTY